jgi:hypothetical protein
MTEDGHNSFRKPNQGNVEEMKEENKEEWNRDGSGQEGKHKEWNHNKFKGFHDSLAFKGNCFFLMGWHRARILFCQVELQQICMEGQFAWKVTTLWRGKLFIFDDWNGDDSAKPGHRAWNRYSLAFKTVFAEGNGNDSM